MCRVVLSALFILLPLYADDRVERYALIVVGCADTNAKLHPALDPIDRNAFFVQVTKLYKALRRCGFRDENIYILYGDGAVQPDWSERQDHEELLNIKRNHFTGEYSNIASSENIETMMTRFRRKVDENDIFVFYLITHGYSDGAVILAGRRKWGVERIQRTLSGLRTRHAVFCFEACFSGKILEKTDFPNAVCVAAAPGKRPAWIDRNFANCVNFILAKANPQNDKNGDGFVSIEEAMEAVYRMAAEYKPKWRKYIKRYRLPKDTPGFRKAVRRVSFKAVLKVGNRFRDFSLFLNKKGDTILGCGGGSEAGVGASGLIKDEEGK